MNLGRLCISVISCHFQMFPKLREKINHFDSYEKELKVLNQAYLVLGYSWTSHNSHQRMDCQKSDWEGRGGRREVWKGGGRRFMDVFGFFCLFGWFFFCTTWLKSFLVFVFVVFLNPYFDLFSLVNNLNFPHPHPSPPTPLNVPSPWAVIPLQRRCHLFCLRPLRFHHCYSPK